MSRSTLFSFIAVFGISVVGFNFLGEKGGLLGWIHSACFMGLVISTPVLGIALVGSLIEIFVDHKIDRTQFFCSQCGEQASPEWGQLWSKCPSWKCANCGASGGRRSAIEIPPNCWEVNRQAILKDIEERRRDWKKTNPNKSPKKSIPFSLTLSEEERKDLEYEIKCKIFELEQHPLSNTEAEKLYDALIKAESQEEIVAIIEGFKDAKNPVLINAIDKYARQVFVLWYKIAISHNAKTRRLEGARLIKETARILFKHTKKSVSREDFSSRSLRWVNSNISSTSS
ncbi:MAG: hypothetical protein WCH99_15880 [Verrucomicrobiota bacterium]